MDKAGSDKMAEKYTKRREASARPVYDEIKKHNDWNPFESVDPEVIADIHKRHERNKIVHILAD